MRQVIKCGHLFDVNEKRFREQANVYIEGNEIVKVEYGAAGPCGCIMHPAYVE